MIDYKENFRSRRLARLAKIATMLLKMTMVTMMMMAMMMTVMIALVMMIWKPEEQAACQDGKANSPELASVAPPPFAMIIHISSMIILMILMIICMIIWRMVMTRKTIFLIIMMTWNDNSWKKIITMMQMMQTSNYLGEERSLWRFIILMSAVKSLEKSLFCWREMFSFSKREKISPFFLSFR